jgi:HSP20 family molecular chaperone IbpA
MASQTATLKSKETPSTVKIRKEHNDLTHHVGDVISRRAYALYLADGGADGQDLNHWLRAEAEVLTRVPEIRESSSWYTVNLPLPGFAPEQIEVSIDKNRALISADKAKPAGQEKERDAFPDDATYLIAIWPSPVEPSTASAYLKDEILTFTVKRSEASVHDKAVK